MNAPDPKDQTLAGTRLVSQAEHDFLVEGYRVLLPLSPQIEPRLHSALRETLATPGSLARAQLAYGLAAGSPRGLFAARDVAIAIEYFHTASLLLDDLPCMDNARERRGRLCPHVVYGEATAILAGLALITQSYALLWRNLSTLPPRRQQRASALVQECLGVSGMLNGQARDLSFAGGPASAREVIRVARGKTVSLIRLTLLLPALINGATTVTLRRLGRVAEAWGLAYQALDDFKDCLFAAEQTGKTTQRDLRLGRPNLVWAAGRRSAMLALHRQLRDARATLEKLGSLRGRVLDRLQLLLENEAARINERLAATG